MAKRGNARAYRKRAASTSEEDETADHVDRAALKETLEAQKYRKRTHGVDSIGLGTVEVDPSVAEAAAKKKLAEENAPRSGLVVPKKYEAIFGHQLADTAAPTVAKHLDAYIDKEMAKLAEGQVATGDEEKDEDDAYFKSEEFQQNLKQKEREDTKSIMLSGIPEVDLGVESRMKNIEETERLKLEHQKKMANKGGRGSLDKSHENYRFSKGRPVVSDQSQRGGRGGAKSTRGAHGPGRGGRGGYHKGMASDDHVMALFRKRQRRY